MIPTVSERPWYENFASKVGVKRQEIFVGYRSLLVYFLTGNFERAKISPVKKTIVYKFDSQKSKETRYKQESNI